MPLMYSKLKFYFRFVVRSPPPPVQNIHSFDDVRDVDDDVGRIWNLEQVKEDSFKNNSSISTPANIYVPRNILSMVSPLFAYVASFYLFNLQNPNIWIH